MGIKVLILGESGTGKSASMRNFTKDELFLVNVANKPLPFRGKFDTIHTDNYREIRKAIQATSKKVIVIDDSQYLMANEFMRRSGEKGFDKYTEIGYHYWELAQSIDQLSDDTITYVFGHIDRDQSGNEKVKTIGKLLDEKITVEGMYTIVLKTVIQDGKYYFQTQNSGHDTVKSPMGMFSSTLIPNDLKMVDDAIREYYEMKETTATTSTTPVETVVATEPVVTEPVVETKTLAEKVAEFQNREPGVVETTDVTPVRRRRRVE